MAIISQCSVIHLETFASCGCNVSLVLAGGWKVVGSNSQLTQKSQQTQKCNKNSRTSQNSQVGSCDYLM